MHTKESLIKDMSHSGLDPKGTLIIHASMKAIGDVAGGADTVLDVISAFMSDGLLLFPTHSWHEKSLVNNVFNVQAEPSCVGLLSNMFRQRPGVIRSLHPSHSVAALGKRAKAYTDRDRHYIETHATVTPCPREGCFGGLYDEKAQILFLGAPLTTNTFIHSLEEWLKIPDRLREQSRHIKIIDANGKVLETELIGHFNSLGDVSKNYDKIEKLLLDKGIAHICKIGDAKSYVVDVKPMADLVLELLKVDPDLFVDKREVPDC